MHKNSLAKKTKTSHTNTDVNPTPSTTKKTQKNSSSAVSQPILEPKKSASSAPKATSSSTGEINQLLRQPIKKTGWLPSNSTNTSSTTRISTAPSPETKKEKITMEGTDYLESNSEDAPVEGEKIGIFASAIVTKKCEITFRISPARPDTNLGAQGDHVTSYLAIIMAILSSTDSNTILSAVDKIQKFLIEILRENIPAELTKKIRPLYDNTKRKQLIEQMKGEDTINAADIDLINHSLMYSKLSQLATGLAELVSHLLQRLQEDPLTTSFSAGRANKNKGEGNIVKGAARALAALDRLCEIDTLNDGLLLQQKDEVIVSLKSKKKVEGQDEVEDPVMLYGLNVLFACLFDLIKKPVTSKKKYIDTQISTLLSNLESADSAASFKKHLMDIKEIFLVKNPDIVAEQLGNLYDYEQILHFNLEKAFKKKKPEDYGKLLFKQFPKESHVVNFYDTPQKKRFARISRQNFDALSKTLHRHFAVMRVAFSQLSKEQGYDAITKTFLQNGVLNKLGWEKTLTMEQLDKLLNPEDQKEEQKAAALNSAH